MRRIGPTSGEVTVIRSGYATQALYLAAIAQALKHGREVRAIDAHGATTRFSPTSGAPEEEDW